MLVSPRKRPLLVGLLMLMALISIGFNVFMVRSIVSSLRLTPHGVVSDLYPSWRGTHDLLLHGTNPYLDSQTVEYQRGYYGRIPDDATIGGGVGYQGFVYPLFLCVILAPLAIIPFTIVQWLAIAGLLVLIVWITRSWARLVGWPTSDQGQWIAGLLWTGAAPSLYLVSLQQLTGLAFGILGLTAVAIARRRFGWAGALLAIGMFKPQLTVLVLLGATGWAIREREFVRFVRGFAIAAFVLAASSLALLPDWPHWFIAQVRTYAETNQLWGMLSVIPSGMPRTLVTGAVILVPLVACVLPWLGDNRSEQQFTDVLALLVATTLLVNQGILVYNAILLIFPLVVVAQRCAHHRQTWVRFPSVVAFSLVGLSFASGIVAAGLMLIGTGDVAGAAVDLMGLGFIAAALPLWMSLVALHVSGVVNSEVWPSIQRNATPL